MSIQSLDQTADRIQRKSRSDDPPLISFPVMPSVTARPPLRLRYRWHLLGKRRWPTHEFHPRTAPCPI